MILKGLFLFILMNYNVIRKIFPCHNCNDMSKLKYDSEGLWSITHPDSADVLSTKIKIFEKTGIKIDSIFDATAGLGGNTLSFANNFKRVISCELDPKRFEILENNISLYNYKNIKLYNEDSINLISKLEESIDVIFFDPPWGGPTYKYEESLEIYLSGMKLEDVCILISNSTKIKLLIFKLPYNYDSTKLISCCKSFIKTYNIYNEGNVEYVYILFK